MSSIRTYDLATTRTFEKFQQVLQIARKQQLTGMAWHGKCYPKTFKLLNIFNTWIITGSVLVHKVTVEINLD